MPAKRSGRNLDNEALDAIGRKDREWFASLTDAERKELGLWKVMRLLSAAPSDAVWHLIATADFVASNFSAFSKHPELQFMRMQIVGSGRGGKRHAWIPPARRGKAQGRLHAFLAEMHPHMKDEDIAEAIADSTMEELKAMLAGFGMDAKAQREHLNGIKV